MKLERGLVFVSLVLFGILFISFVYASVDSSIENKANQIEGSIQQTEQDIQDAENFLTRDEVRKEYLKKEWGKLLETKPFFKQVIGGYRKVSPYSDPIVEFLVGMTPQLSLLFVLVFVIWCTLIKYFYTFYQALRDLELFSGSTNVIVYVLVFVVFILVQLFQSASVFLANKLITLIELVLNPYVQLLLWSVAAVVFILLSRFSKKAVDLLKLYRIKSARKKGREDEIEAREKLIRAAEAVTGVGASSSASMRRAREKEERGESEYERSTADEL
jgi:hypothetical protein